MKKSQLGLFTLKAITAASALALSSQVLAVGSIETGITAYQQKHYSKALEVFHHYSKKHEPRAQYYLSVLYRQGLGVERDDEVAFLWCKRAADKGMLDAQYQLGIMYLQGEGVGEDDALALEWLWQAADRGHKQAKEVLQFALENDFTTGC
ncbi:MAG: tetratricopeptide repeat protein [Rhodothermales bacterium]|jgi:TPR repeat protein